MNEQDTRKT